MPNYVNGNCWCITIKWTFHSQFYFLLEDKNIDCIYRNIFSKNDGNDDYLRPLTNHDKDIFTNHGKILPSEFDANGSRKLLFDAWRYRALLTNTIRKYKIVITLLHRLVFLIS